MRTAMMGPRRLVCAVSLLVLAWGTAAAAQNVVRPGAPRAKPAAPKTVRAPTATVSVNVRPATPVVTYGYTNVVYFRPPYGTGYVPAYGSAVVSPYVAPFQGGQGWNYPTFGGTAASPGPYGTFGIPSYNYNYYGGASGGYGTMTPGLTIGVGNAGYGPWTYVGPVY